MASPPSPTTSVKSSGALLITPLALSTIEEKTCPICRAPYIEPPTAKPSSSTTSTTSTTQPTTTADQEWPVSIDMVAEWFGPKRCCGHIMGRHCLEKHLRTSGEWSNKCPICRDVWFHRVVPKRSEVEDESPGDEVVAEDTGNNGKEELVEGLRRSRRIAEQNTGGEESMGERNGVRRKARRQAVRTMPAQFTAQLLAALEVEEGSDEIKGTMSEVERRLAGLYRVLEAGV